MKGFLSGLLYIRSVQYEEDVGKHINWSTCYIYSVNNHDLYIENENIQ